MATSPKTAQNAQHASFPSLFKRTGEARRIKGFRASRETFNQAMRSAKALDLCPRLMVLTPQSVMVLSEAATHVLKEDGGVASLLLNGFSIMPYNHMMDVSSLHDEFLAERNMLKGEDLLTRDMFEGEE